MMWPSPGVVSGSPSSSSQNSSPRFLGVQRRFVHPIIGTDMHQVQVSELLGEILERHPDMFNVVVIVSSSWSRCITKGKIR